MLTKPLIVITTIFPPNHIIRAYAKLGHQLIVAGDKKTPTDWASPNCEYLSLAKQHSLFPDFSKQLPVNHYGRKNIGYLRAMQLADTIIETDDDNLPYDFYPNFVTGQTKTTQLRSSSKFINIYQQFSSDQNIWPRGFPLREVLEKPQIKSSVTNQAHFIQQGLVDGDTDVDAIYRLTNNKHITFKPGKKASLAPHHYCPINTQNTFWQKQAFLLMYLPVFTTFRSCDIYKGWIAQRLVWELDSSILFISPSVKQERNPHDYLKDFESELPLFLDTEKFIDVLETVKLAGSMENKFRQVYQALIRAKLLDTRELKLVDQWIKEVNKIQTKT